MARISYNATTLGGKLVADGINHVRLAKENFDRAKALADSISSGGSIPAALDTSVDFGCAVGSGGALYTAISNARANVNVITDQAIAEIDVTP